MNPHIFNNQDPVKLNMPDSDIQYFSNFFDDKKSDEFFTALIRTIKWQLDDITVFGKTYPQPRLTALYASNNNSYRYSNITMSPHLFTKELLFIKRKVETVCAAEFTTCLLNLYRDGQDSNGWHSDNEKELGKNPIIASISFGQERWFHFKHKIDKNLKSKILLRQGDLIIMKGKTQEYWLHQIPKTKKIIEPRINLTFRVIK